MVRSVLSPSVHVECGSSVHDSIIMDNVRIGRGVRIRRAIIDKNNVIPDEAVIGEDPEWDNRHFTLTPKGIVAVPKETPFPHRS